jgi:hypothetical protein
LCRCNHAMAPLTLDMVVPRAQIHDECISLHEREGCIAASITSYK